MTKAKVSSHGCKTKTRFCFPSTTTTTDPKGAMSRRSKHDLQQKVDFSSGVVGDSYTVKGKTRKRKRNDRSEQSTNQPEIPAENPKELEEASLKKKKKKEAILDIPAAQPESSSSRKRKKASKDKGKQKEAAKPTQQEQQNASIDPTLTDNAFLSAVMAAAAASAGTPIPPTPQQFTAEVQQQQQEQVAEYISNIGIGMNTTPNGSFSPLGGNTMTPNLDLAFQQYTGEELARLLSGLDIPKIADAIRILGDAGATSIFPASGQHTSGPSNQSEQSQLGAQARSLLPSCTVRDRKQYAQVPAPSALILNQPPAAPPNLVPPPVPTQVPVEVVNTGSNNAEHARMLANKWISATKLNELAESEGLTIFLIILCSLVNTPYPRPCVQEGKILSHGGSSCA